MGIIRKRRWMWGDYPGAARRGWRWTLFGYTIWWREF